ncbi:MAG: hypothetical protein ACLFV2_05560 [Desulfurivibrionaceae bacterium]
MNRYFYKIATAMMLVFAMAFTASAAQHEDQDRKGKHIHTSTVDDHEMAYYLIDMGDMGAGMEGHEGQGEQAATHHLMVYIADPAGNLITGAKTGFLIQGPEGEKQKTMAMGMSGGYGADIALGAPGDYTIKTKAKTEDKTLIDSFSYSGE